MPRSGIQKLVTNNLLKTLAYFSVFNFPLTKEEIIKFSACRSDATEESLRSDMRLRLLLRSEGIFRTAQDDIFERGGYFGLSDPNTWVDRKVREATSLAKIEAATRLFKKIAWWPYLKAVLVTGSVAAMNAEGGSDVDVLIISSKDALWLTRLVIVAFLISTRTYRSFICPNIWLSEDNLEWPDKNIHSACDLILAKPIINKNNTYESFIDANHWVQDFWPFTPVILSPVEPEGFLQRRRNDNVSILGIVVNNLLFTLEKLRRQLLGLKNTADEITYNRIQYKKNDSKSRILAKYQANLDLLTKM